jgi:hypothetical protein
LWDFRWERLERLLGYLFGLNVVVRQRDFVGPWGQIILFKDVVFGCLCDDDGQHILLKS